MNVVLLPSSLDLPVADAPQYLTSFLINECVAIDAGPLGLFRRPQDQQGIRDVFLSHSHIDHLASLPVFLENVHRTAAEPVRIHALEPVLASLQTDIFNDRVWPNLLRLGRADAPLVELRELVPGQAVEVGMLRVTPIPVNHVVPTAGFIIEDPETAVVIATDTGPTEEIWQRANALPHLKAVFLEASFPNQLAWLAEASKHLTPALLEREVGKLHREVPVVVVHVKPQYAAEVIHEIRALSRAQVIIGQAGREYTF
ncbi:MAG: 3',5'-cyclic-nucleotide phosphodiesterase [Gemmataceae bacterium]|nr:3',5'-cyclic-nucleotide phosphodiesterase [Gemmataceae bacterium]MDW8265358.1 3',5'-cyclic-nucleotide phosphodiesterase [Gemmataceae bacterium]